MRQLLFRGNGAECKSHVRQIQHKVYRLHWTIYYRFTIMCVFLNVVIPAFRFVIDFCLNAVSVKSNCGVQAMSVFQCLVMGCDVEIVWSTIASRIVMWAKTYRKRHCVQNVRRYKFICHIGSFAFVCLMRRLSQWMLKLLLYNLVIYIEFVYIRRFGNFRRCNEWERKVCPSWDI